MIDLYTWFTPNGRKVSIMLEETGLPYTVHSIHIGNNEQFDPEFLKISPNNKIPAIKDREEDIAMMESGAILIYLAEKTGRVLSSERKARSKTLEWLMFQMGGVGPMFGQLGFFHKFAGKDYEDKRPRDRYVAEAQRLLGVLDRRLQGRDWLMGGRYSIADIATFPWVRGLVEFYEARELVEFERFVNVQRVLDAFVARPAVAKGLNIPARG